MLEISDSLACTASPRDEAITAIDTHAHVFVRDLPLARQRRYAPGYDAPLGAYLAQLDAHGVSHGVLVQPSFLGTDNGYLLQSLAAQPERLRGIVVIDPLEAAADAQRLQRWARAGVVGIRLNLLGMSDPDFAAAAWQTLLPRLAALRWQIELQCEASRLARLVRPLLEHGLDVVIDHFGLPDPAQGVTDPGFRYLLTLGATRRVWVKLSAAYRSAAGVAGEAIARAATPLLKQAFGLDRLLWGSDWPHTRFETTVDYSQACRAIQALLPDADERRAVLVDTPARLFRFG
ncbi:amidohydrolase family protein [Pandoraea sp.]|uniref:amidohydrolase family protein n=1 Tax=Pandoraea sp. TaxID=1883445 RepID=UPI001222E2F0|nr:amidohydrolase family protein [Pandoraea sp.]TAL52079.1 MAG: hypothetical protein EPN80_20770 [Pandoraea sp.]TAM17974.1 MAG: hypothetical protein EPN65_08830 [Pandoraea sp.]